MTEKLNPEQKRALEEGRRRAMTSYGVGPRYHDRSLTELKNGDKLVKWVTETAPQAISKGNGLTFIGIGAPATDAAILTARALNSKGISAYVLTMTTLVRWVEKPALAGTDAWTRMTSAPALVIPNFYSRTPVYGNGSPLEYWQSRALEDFLMERLNANKAVLPVTESPLTSCQWYRPDLLHVLDENNQQFIV